MKVCTFTIPTQDEEIFAKFDEWVKANPQYFESSRKSRNGGLRSAALVGLMKFIVENPRSSPKCTLTNWVSLTCSRTTKASFQHLKQNAVFKVAGLNTAHPIRKFNVKYKKNIGKIK